jgi:ER membrane protein complex subunit 1
LSDLICLRDVDTSSGTPVVAWLQQGTLTYLPLTPELKGRPIPVKGPKYKEIVDVGLRDKGQFVAVKLDWSSSAVLWNAEGSNFTIFWDFAHAVSHLSPDVSES